MSNWYDELEAGRRAYFQNQWELARTHFSRALISNSADSQYWLGKTQMQQGALSEAFENLSAAAQKSHPEALLAWSECALKLERRAELKALLTRPPLLQTLTFQHWQSLQELLIADEAWDVLGALGASLLAFDSPSKRAQGYFYLGFSCQRLYRSDLSLSCYQAGLQLWPQHQQLRKAYLKLLNFGGAYQQAIEALNGELRQEPRVLELHLLRAQAAKGLGLHRQVLQELERLKQVFQQPLEHAKILFQAGQVWTELGEAAPAVEAYRAFSRLPYLPNDKERSRQYHKLFVESKLQHDLEQVRYLLDVAALDAPQHSRASQLEGELAALQQDLAPLPHTEELDTALQRRWESLSLRHLYIPQWKPPPAPWVNPELPFAELEARYFAQTPRVLVFDHFLRQEVVDWLREYCLQGTFWHDYWRNPGYVGSYEKDGFYCELLFGIARELQERFPRLIGPHRLRNIWAYKYNNRMRSGVHPHVDPAAVNVNFWLTPDRANLQPERGGLIVFPAKIPPFACDEETDRFNHDPQQVMALMEQSQAQAIRIPYRQNRVIFFDSALFHKSDDLHFDRGYTQRRLNLAYIFGERERAALRPGNLSELASLFDVSKTSILHPG